MKGATRLQDLIIEVGVSHGITDLTKNEVNHFKTKHISVKHNFVRESIDV